MTCLRKSKHLGPLLFIRQGSEIKTHREGDSDDGNHQDDADDGGF